MIDDNDIHRLDEIYVRKDDCQDIQNYENHSGFDGDIASHKSTAICWRYQKAKGITKRGRHPLKGAVLFIFPLQRKKYYNFFRIFAK